MLCVAESGDDPHPFADGFYRCGAGYIRHSRRSGDDAAILEGELDIKGFHEEIIYKI